MTRTSSLERVVVVDASRADRRQATSWLAERGLDVTTASRLEGVSLSRYGLAILAIDLLSDDWVAELSRLKRLAPRTELILTAEAGEGSVETAVLAIREGAFDYLVKPLDASRLPVLAVKALDKRTLSEENRHLRERLSLKDEYGHVIGKSRAIADIYDVVEQVSGTMAAVLLTGEQGTGKELVAKAIHRRSPRRERPFVCIHCGALPEELLESELFGVERGAGAASTLQRGKFELADSGTLFLDEVSEMSPRVQAELLRAIQEQEFRRVGGETLVRADVRFIAATRKDLKREVQDGRFREDLFFRLAVVPIDLPALRDRSEDIPFLVEGFLAEFARANRRAPKKIATRAMAELVRYPWPGNIRELRNVIERLTVTVDVPTIRPEHLPPEVAAGGEDGNRGIVIRLGTPLDKVEEIVIRHTLQELTSHRKKAASILGISPRALHYKLARYGVARRQRRP